MKCQSKNEKKKEKKITQKNIFIIKIILTYRC